MVILQKLTSQIRVGDEYFDIETEYDNFSVSINNKEHEPWINHFSRIVLKGSDKPVIFDVGANIGLMSIPFSKINKKGQVYAFEALPQCIHLLENNIKRNSIKNVQIIKKAVSSSPGILEINLPSGMNIANAFISQSSFDEKLSMDKIPVEAITLDEFVGSSDIKKIDLMKIDVEGWEEHVLSGAEKSIQKFKPCCIIEFNVTPVGEKSEERAYSLWKKIQNLFDRVYLIDKLFLNLYEVNNFAELRSLMLIGHNVEDLLCFNSSDVYDKIKENLQSHRYSSYGSTVAIKHNDGLISFLSYYADGWSHGNSISIISGLDKNVRIDVECFWQN